MRQNFAIDMVNIVTMKRHKTESTLMQIIQTILLEFDVYVSGVDVKLNY